MSAPLGKDAAPDRRIRRACGRGGIYRTDTQQESGLGRLARPLAIAAAANA